MDAPSSNIYRHSGKLGRGWIVIPLCGIPFAILAGFIYSLLDVYIPIAGVVTVFLVFGFGAVVGSGVVRLARVSKCRSVAFVGLCGCVLGVAALYSAWVMFEFLLLRRDVERVGFAELVRLFFSPVLIAKIAIEISKNGWYSIGGGTPSGVVIWITWMAESGIVLFFSTTLAIAGIDKSVFCETARRWCRQWSPIRLALPDDEAVLPRLRGGDFVALASLKQVDGTSYPRLNLVVHEAPSGGTTHAWELNLLQQTIDRKGKKKEKSTSLTPKYLASDGDVECLRLLAERVVDEPAPAMEMMEAEESVA